MKTYTHTIQDEAARMDDIMSVCGGVPRGDELPQVASEDDILVDVYSDISNLPREYACAQFHHQLGEAAVFEDIDVSFH